MKIRIGSRDSALAVIQSRMVMRAIAEAEPRAELELVTMKTTGDRILDRTLDQVGGKGLFVKELDQALRDGRADFTGCHGAGTRRLHDRQLQCRGGQTGDGAAGGSAVGGTF